MTLIEAHIEVIIHNLEQLKEVSTDAVLVEIERQLEYWKKALADLGVN